MARASIALPTPANDADNVSNLWKHKLAKVREEERLRLQNSYMPPERGLLLALLAALKSGRKRDRAIAVAMQLKLAKLKGVAARSPALTMRAASSTLAVTRPDVR